MMGVMTDSETLDRMSSRWAEPRGLVMLTTWMGTATLAPILRGDREPESWRRTGAVQELLDHSRHFRVPGGRKPAVAVSAPYAANLLNEWETWGRVVDEARAIAHEAGLHVRIGVESDAVYQGRVPETMPIVPFVWWDRSRIDLETIELRQRFA